MANYNLTNKAVEDLAKIWDYTFDKWSEQQADKYYKVVREEIGFRKLGITAHEALEDTWQACYTLAERNTKSEDFNHLQLGIKNFTNFTFDKFNLEDAIISAAKVAYLTKLILSEVRIKEE